METLKEKAKVNYVQLANGVHPQKVSLSLRESIAVMKDCRARVWSQVIIPVLIAEAEFMKVWDICEERKEIRFNRGKWLRGTLASFEKFREWMKMADQHTKALIDDYAIQVQKRIKREQTSLFVTFRRYFEEHGQKDLDFKANVQMVLTYITLARDLFDGFFDTYQERFGIDLRKEYLPVRIIDADLQFSRFADDVIQPSRNDLHPCKNWASIKAYEELIEKLMSEKMLDKAGLEALKLNNEDEFLSKIERETMGFEKLKEKYNVGLDKRITGK